MWVLSSDFANVVERVHKICTHFKMSVESCMSTKNLK